MKTTIRMKREKKKPRRRWRRSVMRILIRMSITLQSKNIFLCFPFCSIHSSFICHVLRVNKWNFKEKIGMHYNNRDWSTYWKCNFCSHIPLYLRTPEKPATQQWMERARERRTWSQMHLDIISCMALMWQTELYFILFIYSFLWFQFDFSSDCHVVLFIFFASIRNTFNSIESLLHRLKYL